MVHHSRLGTIIFDCKDADMDLAAKFWAAAMGLEAEAQADGFPEYRTLSGNGNDPTVLVQRVDHESRVHIDIETDDKTAECKRLEELGAKIVTQVNEPGKDWIVMEAPTGHRFCIVGPQRPDFSKNANKWGNV